MIVCRALRFNLGTPSPLPLPLPLPSPLTSGVYARQAEYCQTSSSLPLRSKCVSLSAAEGFDWDSSEYFAKNCNLKSRSGGWEDGGEGVGDGERAVHCEVKVISWRERRIRADILVNAAIESVWNALTDYERLADFIPNLVSSGRIPCPHPGRIWLEQRGLQRALYWHIEARVVLDLQELLNSDGSRELHFSMVDGDFKKFEGKWSIKAGTRSSPTTLSYEVNVIPRFNFPAILLERIIRSDLPVNLRALACRAEENSEGGRRVGTTEDSKSMVLTNTVNGASCENDELQETSRRSNSNSNLGPLPPLSNELNSNWGVFGKVCRLDKRCMVDEVHLRRFDGLLENGGVHRCVVASITVKAPVREVWNVLTAYESLPEVVPNLAISKILSRESNKVRILQVEGDFDSLSGKWHFEQLGSHHTLLKYSVESRMHKDTFLSEALMEEVVYEDLPSNLCAIRDSIEKRGSNNSFEAFDEGRHSEEKSASYHNDQINGYTMKGEGVSDDNGKNSCRPKPKVAGLQRDIEVLKAEVLKFISEHGQEGFMPMRKQLRMHGRVDIEKAITRMGGFRRIASIMNLSLAYKHRKPKGYWDKFDNLQEEINRFQTSWGMDPSYMPSRKSFERAGRYDIARALEKWGGLHEVSRLLSLKVRHPNRQPSFAKDRKNDSLAFNGHDAENKTASRPYISQDTEKWLSGLKYLDINWVE
ncbi:uncharacterized protein LOC111022083 isoform X2 [Momordica charantia]|uniref:Uncharacterized protein LOC111022083 isoform X2 n=1 Tax=Momordica charantia TaxID=3673 RepID=A0A6J1DQ70_MOMCH|nr:uncharacterized protein LOC111022083 isoform X2 [Momordica charantia]